MAGKTKQARVKRTKVRKQLAEGLKRQKKLAASTTLEAEEVEDKIEIGNNREPIPAEINEDAGKDLAIVIPTKSFGEVKIAENIPTEPEPTELLEKVVIQKDAVADILKKFVR